MIRHPDTFPASLEAGGIRLRWLVENCWEIRLCNGKTILIDPCLPAKGERMDLLGFGCGYTVDDLEGCDYVLINHTHTDHVFSLGKVIERFDPRILVHGNCLLQLAKVYHIQDPYRMFPLQYGQSYDFGDFRLRTYPAQHIDITRLNRPPRPKDIPFSVDEEEALLNDMGAVFNMNFLIVTPDNLRLAFDGGEHIPALNDWREAAPNVLFRHIDMPQLYGDLDGAARHMADSLERSGAEYLLLNCAQGLYRDDNPMDLHQYAETVNGLMAARGGHGRLFNCEMGRWYTLAPGIRRD